MRNCARYRIIGEQHKTSHTCEVLTEKLIVTQLIIKYNAFCTSWKQTMPYS